MSQAGSILEPLHNLFEETCFDVFNSIQCNLQKVDTAKDILAVPCAHIDAISEDLNVKLLLRGPVSILKQTYPIDGDKEEIKVQDLEDWISELANRFMGDLKNKLINYQHYLQLGTPIKQFGLSLKEFAEDGYEAVTFKFKSGREVFECSLHTKVLNESLAFEYQEPEDDPFADGELEMF
jgi:hypothetical protein